MNIDNLFDQVRESKPLLDIKDVNTLLSSSKPVKKVKYGEGFVAGAITAGAILGVIGIYLYNEQNIPIVKSISKQPVQTFSKADKKNTVLPDPSNSENSKRSIILSKTDEEGPKTNETISTNKPINMQSLKVLELSSTQLSKMGITTDGVIRVPHQIGSDSLYTTIGYSSKGTFLDFSTEYRYKNYRDRGVNKDIKSMNIKDQEYIPLILGKEKFGNNILQGQLEKEKFIEPVLVTDDLGVHWRSYRYTDKLSKEDYYEMQMSKVYDKVAHQRQEAEADLLSVINTLIPILVRVDRQDTSFKRISDIAGVKDRQWRPDVILWYEPSEALFNLLPEDISNEIRKEYTAIQQHEPSPGCKHFESCQIVTGKINSYSIYPNPCEDELNLTIDIQEDRSFTISLHDISGKEVKNYGEQLIQVKGEKEYHFSLNGLNSGMYMLLITSSKGEYIVQRIIKK
jgi:hypothetical protein